MCNSAYGTFLLSFIQICESTAMKTAIWMHIEITSRIAVFIVKRQTGGSSTGGGLITTWSDVKSALESSLIIFSSGNTWKSVTKRNLFVATVPGSSQVNRAALPLKSDQGRIQLPLHWMWENGHWEKPLRRSYECT